MYVISGPEFGPIQGRKMVIIKALYGLKTSGAMWHQRIADSLRRMGFRSCKDDTDLWKREMKDHYEYVAVIVDDLLVLSKLPQEILSFLTEEEGFELK